MAEPTPKRPIEYVDLTGDALAAITPLPEKRHKTETSVAPSQQLPTPPTSSNADPSSQQRHSSSMPATPQQVDADAEVEGHDDFADESHELLATIQTKIVGIQYYRGRATVGEIVLIRREPTNPYDSNALRVDNVQLVQIGHIGRAMASKLAPLMDDKTIFVEGILAGEKGPFDVPLHLKLFGSGDPAQKAAAMLRFKTSGISQDFLTEWKRQNALRKKAETAQRIMSNMKSSSYLVNDGPSTCGNEMPSMDDIFNQSTQFNPRELGAVADQYGQSEEQLASMPMASQPEALKTNLLPYQRQGLAWLLACESPTLPGAGSSDVVQLWKCGRRGGYINIATNYSTDSPGLASGGIMADDMGLGKTIQTISLILVDPKRNEWPTLIVSPLSVMSNWSTQMAAHIRPEHQLKVLIYHGPGRYSNQRPEDLMGYDVIITNYETMAIEFHPQDTPKELRHGPPRNGLFSIKYRRIVLDEGHMIRNPKARKTQAAYALAELAASRWVLTGTPIVNSLKDLQSHVRFIGLSGGLEQPEVFGAALTRPLNKGDPKAPMLLKALVGTPCLRRMKDMKFVDLKLPEVSYHKSIVRWRAHEREKCDALSNEAQGLLDQYTSREPGGAEQGNNDTYRHLLEVLLRLRQVCNHWSLCRERVMNAMGLFAKDKQVKLTPENVAALQGLLQLSMDSSEECPVCMEDLHSPRITNCGHVFGAECIERVIEVQHKCPMCRAPLEDVACLVQPAAGMGESSQADDDADDSLDAGAPSSKMDLLRGILHATRNKDPTRKTVVFSQWTSFLDLVQAQLRAQGIKHCRLDGKLKAEARDAATEALNGDAECGVMLASLAVCSVGLNLVAASQVVLCGSWWSAAIEDQAVDRVNRLGRTRPVDVFRLVMEESVEERVLEVQARKRTLVQTAFGEGRVAGQRGVGKQARVAEIQRLLN